MLFRVSKNGDVVEVATSQLQEQKLYEMDVENWVAKRPDILGEPLLIIGRQVAMDDGKDRIDLLALDQSANLVVIELKRDLIGGSADLQALRYAALVSTWTHDTIRQQAEDYWRSSGQQRGTFAQEIAAFCGEDYELNTEQRVILAGRDIKPRLGTMALWLRKHQLDVRVAAIALLQDDDQLYLQPQVIIPVPTEERLQRPVSVISSDKPWLQDGQKYHLEQRCSPKGREIVEALVPLVGKAVPSADGPYWSQKFYIAWKHNGKIWTALDTGSPNRSLLTVSGLKRPPEQIADDLGYQLFDGDAELSEKYALGSSVGQHGDEIRLIVKTVADATGEKAAALALILREAWAGLTGEVIDDGTSEEDAAAEEPVGQDNPGQLVVLTS